MNRKKRNTMITLAVLLFLVGLMLLDIDNKEVQYQTYGSQEEFEYALDKAEGDQE